MAKVVAVTSGGMDSIAAGLMELKEGHEVLFLHLNYGQKAEPSETRTCKRIVKKLKAMGHKAELMVIKIPFGHLKDKNLYSLMGKSTCEVPNGMASLDMSSTGGGNLFIPARNVVFLAYAASVAEDIGAEFVTLGCNQSESAYGDNTKEFLDRMTAVAELGCLKSHPKFISPEWNMDKAEILNFIKQEFRSIASMTWSCDENGKYMCGHCGCCCNRLFADLVVEKKFKRKSGWPKTVDQAYFTEVFMKDLKAQLDSGKTLWMSKYKDIVDEFFAPKEKTQ